MSKKGKDKRRAKKDEVLVDAYIAVANNDKAKSSFKARQFANIAKKRLEKEEKKV